MQPPEVSSTGSRFVVHDDVQQYFDALTEAVLGAQQSVDLCFFAFLPGQVAQKLAGALVHRAQAGVPVRVLLDGAGMLADQFTGVLQSHGVIHDLQNGGVTVRVLWPRRSRWWPVGMFGRIHGKMVVIDGERVFTGGSNVGDWYLETRDTNFDITGPLAADFLAYFDYLFNETPDTPGDAQTPPWKTRWRHKRQHKKAAAGYRKSHGRVLRYPREAALLLTVPGRCFEIRRALVAALMQAREVIEIRTWYSVPDPFLVWLLAAKARQGVRVRLLRSDRTKVFLADVAAAWIDGWLLRRGVRVFRYTAKPLHAKTFRCDNLVLSGSPNLDAVSFYGNHEVMFRTRHRELALTLGEVFEKDLTGAVAATPATGRLNWLRGALAYCFCPVL